MRFSTFIPLRRVTKLQQPSYFHASSLSCNQPLLLNPFNIWILFTAVQCCYQGWLKPTFSLKNTPTQGFIGFYLGFLSFLGFLGFIYIKSIILVRNDFLLHYPYMIFLDIFSNYLILSFSVEVTFERNTQEKL